MENQKVWREFKAHRLERWMDSEARVKFDKIINAERNVAFEI